MKIQILKSQASILNVARKLGINTDSINRAKCFNQAVHKNRDRTPSLKFYPETNSFYCFGCGIGGDVIELIKHFYQISTGEALKLLEGLM